MPTSFAVTTFAVLTVLNHTGQLAPIDKTEVPAPFTTGIAYNLENCEVMRGKMEHPKSMSASFSHPPKQQAGSTPPRAP